MGPPPELLRKHHSPERDSWVDAHCFPDANEPETKHDINPLDVSLFAQCTPEPTASAANTEHTANVGTLAVAIDLQPDENIQTDLKGSKTMPTSIVSPTA